MAAIGFLVRKLVLLEYFEEQFIDLFGCNVIE